MSNKGTKIVLLGKRTEDGESLDMILTEVFPNSIPKDFVHNFSITIDDGEVIDIPNEMLPDYIEVQHPVDILKSINIKNAKVDVIEVVLDLESIKTYVTTEADTILNNITLYNPNISFDDVVSAAKKIGIHDFIMSMPGGYNYNVKERGVMLSQGQRQLISFLRSYIKNPSILILDEATSSIDSNSEELIQKATLKITENKTSIIIAHRLSTIVNSDRIFVMNGGELVESGSHKELIKKKNGYYKNLYDVQFKNEKFSQVPLPV